MLTLAKDELDKKPGKTNLKGAAIGDGCWGNTVGTCSSSPDGLRIAFKTFAGHSMVDQPLVDSIEKECDFSGTSISDACQKLINEMDNNLGDFDVYNIYDQCGNDQMSASEVRALHALKSFHVNGTSAFRPHPQRSLGGALNDYACGAETMMDKWLANSEVRKALHVNKTGDMQYHRTAGDLRPLYSRLAQKYRL